MRKLIMYLMLAALLGVVTPEASGKSYVKTPEDISRTPFPVLEVDEKKRQEEKKKEKISEAVQKHTVSVFSLGGQSGFCSGVVIRETLKHTYVLTNKHCVGPTEETLVENTQAYAIFTPMDEDLALIIIKGSIPNKTAATMAKEDAKIGDELVHIGFPVFKLWEGWGKLLRTSTDWHWVGLKSRQGCSGGGVYNRDRNLVGILWGGLRRDAIAIYEPISDVKDFLKKVDEYIVEDN